MELYGEINLSFLHSTVPIKYLTAKKEKNSKTILQQMLFCSEMFNILYILQVIIPEGRLSLIHI